MFQYVHNFDINCGASYYYYLDDEGGKTIEGRQGAEVLDKLISSLAHCGHLVVMNNSFQA